MRQSYEIVSDDDDRYYVVDLSGQLIIDGPFFERVNAENRRDDLNMKLWDLLEKAEQGA